MKINRIDNWYAAAPYNGNNVQTYYCRECGRAYKVNEYKHIKELEKISWVCPMGHKFTRKG